MADKDSRPGEQQHYMCDQLPHLQALAQQAKQAANALRLARTAQRSDGNAGCQRPCGRARNPEANRYGCVCPSPHLCGGCGALCVATI